VLPTLVPLVSVTVVAGATEKPSTSSAAALLPVMAAVRLPPLRLAWSSVTVAAAPVSSRIGASPSVNVTAPARLTRSGDGLLKKPKSSVLLVSLPVPAVGSVL
jgi:hypothetical protein